MQEAIEKQIKDEKRRWGKGRVYGEQLGVRQAALIKSAHFQTTTTTKIRLCNNDSVLQEKQHPDTDGAQEQWDSLLPHHTTATHTPSPQIPVMAPTESRSNLPPPAIGSAHPLLAARTSIFCSTSNHYGHHFFLICPSCTVCKVLPPKSIYKYAYPNFT